MTFRKYVALCILDEDKEYALEYIEELLFMAHSYDDELIEAFDGYYQTYVDGAFPMEIGENLEDRKVDQKVHNHPLGIGFAHKDKETK